MASLSVAGERSILALLAEQYAEIIELRISLATEQDAHAATRAICTNTHVEKEAVPCSAPSV